MFDPEFFWLRTIFRELRIPNCHCRETSSDLFKFSKTMTLDCFSFVYYSWKSLLLQNILKCAEGSTSSLKIDTDLYNKIAIPAFETEIYQYVNMRKFDTSACKNETFSKNTSQWLLLNWNRFLILSIANYLRAPILKNICERLLLKMCSRN